MQKLRYIYLIFFYVIVQVGSSQTKTIDSLKSLLGASLHDCSRADLLFKIGKAFQENNQNELALRYGKQSLDLSTKLSCEKNLLGCYNLLGISFDENGNYPEARRLFQLGLDLAIKTNDEKFKSVFYTNLGETCRSQADYSKALMYFLEALKIDELKKDEERLVSDYFTLTLLFGNLDELEQQRKYLFKALELSKKINNKRVEAKCYNIYAIILSDESKTDSALYYYNKSLVIAKKIKLTHLEAKVLSNIGGMYREKNDYFNALKYVNYSIALNKKIGDYKFLAADYVTQGWIYIDMENLPESQKYFNLALQLAKGRFTDSEINAYNGLASYNAKTKNFEKAFEYHVKYKVLKDSIYNIENSKQLGDIKTSFEVEKREAELKAEQDRLAMITVQEKKQQYIIIISIAVVLIIVLVFSVFLYKRFKITDQQKKIIALKSIETEKQKLLLEEKQKEIIDSINYAKRLQNALLPSIELINNNLPHNFIYYQPKDIVAGDFYWFEKQNDLLFIAAADCTGHGVPGAMVSVVCSGALTRTINELHITQPHLILNKTRELILETFAKNNEEVTDGMDISLLCIDKKNRTAFWSGANNPLWYLQNNKIVEIKPDKQPIGRSDNPVPFTTHKVDFKEETTFYLFTDGLPDQFGGLKGKKYKYKQMQELLLQNCKLGLNEQKQKLHKSFVDWKGKLEQVDDVCVIGIKV